MHHHTTGAPAPTTPHQGLATTREAQAYLRVSRTTIYKLSLTGALAPVRLGRALRFRWADLQSLARGQGGQP